MYVFKRDQLQLMNHSIKMTGAYWNTTMDLDFTCYEGGCGFEYAGGHQGFSWDLGARMGDGTSTLGQRINQFIKDNFNYYDLYNYMDILHTLEGHTLVKDYGL